MRKTCSIRLFLFGMIITSAFSLCMGFLIGAKKNWNAYEQRISMLQEKNDFLLAQQKAEEEKDLAASLTVQPYEYVLMAEDGYVAVYHADRKTLYASTDILLDTLPQDLQTEITEGKLITSEEQLYSFLENYSS
ncbi:MAG: hypothetical protein HFI70_02570 [Lachnospiraceae bacterium]|nr:hypothetical protein [Lachnospiraceae bacterium]